MTRDRLNEISKAKWDAGAPVRAAEDARRKADLRKAASELPWAWRTAQVRTLWTLDGRDGHFVVAKDGGQGAVKVFDAAKKAVVWLRRATERDVLTRCQRACDRRKMKK